MDFNPQTFLTNKVKGDIKKLYVQFLYILEELEVEEKISEEKYLLLRKRVLDHGNNAVREIAEQMDSFDIQLKK